MSRSKLFDELEKIGRKEKTKSERSKKTYVRFVISNSFLQFSQDLWEECFEGMNSIGMANVTEDDDGNSVNWTFVKGYKGKVALKNKVGLHKVNDRKGSGVKYLNLTPETFKDLNKKLNKAQGGVKSRAYHFPDKYKSPNENLVVIDYNDHKNWINSSNKRTKKDDTDVKTDDTE